MRKSKTKTVAIDPNRKLGALRSRYSVNPLEYMLKVINNDKLPLQLRCEMAKAAAPFVHQKLAPISIDAITRPEEKNLEASLDLSKLTDEELEQLEQIMSKCR